ncbi:hypothetical protein TH5_24815 [Thalassospira xianhensis MCCC 1A02616]|uniref:Uncharacterized protein n=3 Tax=Thalassospira xianhensis TaxID=478503 RepID=A0A367U693_9PROT|nr:hypothetical protein TH5_24815 [Thalassospira xianhensis MCCC 1A02616]
MKPAAPTSPTAGASEDVSTAGKTAGDVLKSIAPIFDPSGSDGGGVVKQSDMEPVATHESAGQPEISKTGSK